jgi:hypothetical protein
MRGAFMLRDYVFYENFITTFDKFYNQRMISHRKLAGLSILMRGAFMLKGGVVYNDRKIIRQLGIWRLNERRIVEAGIY